MSHEDVMLTVEMATAFVRGVHPALWMILAVMLGSYLRDR